MIKSHFVLKELYPVNLKIKYKILYYSSYINHVSKSEYLNILLKII